MSQIKTPEQIARETTTAHAVPAEGRRRDEIHLLIVNAIKTDRAQRAGIDYDTLDRLLSAWDAYDGDVSGFYDAWIDHINEGSELPDWATRS